MTNDTSTSDHELDDGGAAAAAIDTEEPEAMAAEENEDSLNGFGSASSTSSTMQTDEEEEDDNEYYRKQAIAEANRKYTPDDSRDNGAGGEEGYNSGSSDETGSSSSAVDDSATGGEKQATTERQDILNRVGPAISVELEGHQWEVTSYSPFKFIIAREDLRRLVHACVKTSEVEDKKTHEIKLIKKLRIDKVIVNAIPTEIVLEQSPLGFGFTTSDWIYTITYKTFANQKKFTIKSKSIDEQVAELKQRALVCESRGAIDGLSIIIGAYNRSDLITVNNDIQNPGFYYLDGQLRAYHIVSSKNNDLPKQPTKEEIDKCIQVIERLVSKYRRKEVIPTILKWAIAAPFNFALKQYTKDMEFLRWLYPYGWTRTGKTTLGNIVLAVWNLMSDSKYKVPFTKVDTEARFGNIISQTTFPLIINEVSSLGDEKHRPLLEMFKNAIETTIARGKFVQKSNYNDIPALSACILTGNPRPPQDSGFQARITRYVFTKDDEHTVEQKKEFEAFLIREVYPSLGVLGDFTANYIMQHPEVLLKPNKEDCDPIATATQVLKRFYVAADKVPDWIDYFVEEPQQILEDSKDDSRLLVRSFFVNTINEAYQRYARMIDPTITIAVDSSSSSYSKTLEERFKLVCKNNIISFLTLTDDEHTVVILGNVMKELRNQQKFGIGESEIASMQELSSTMGLKHGQMWLNGRNTKVVYGEFKDFVDFINSNVKDENPNNDNDGDEFLLSEEVQQHKDIDVAIAADVDLQEKWKTEREGIYKATGSDRWYCKYCSMNGDKWLMRSHNCKLKT